MKARWSQLPDGRTPNRQCDRVSVRAYDQHRPKTQTKRFDPFDLSQERAKKSSAAEAKNCPALTHAVCFVPKTISVWLNRTRTPILSLSLWFNHPE